MECCHMCYSVPRYRNFVSCVNCANSFCYNCVMQNFVQAYLQKPKQDRRQRDIDQMTVQLLETVREADQRIWVCFECKKTCYCRNCQCKVTVSSVVRDLLSKNQQSSSLEQEPNHHEKKNSLEKIVAGEIPLLKGFQNKNEIIENSLFQSYFLQKSLMYAKVKSDKKAKENKDVDQNSISNMEAQGTIVNDTHGISQTQKKSEHLVQGFKPIQSAALPEEAQAKEQAIKEEFINSFEKACQERHEGTDFLDCSEQQHQQIIEQKIQGVRLEQKPNKEQNMMKE